METIQKTTETEEKPKGYMDYDVQNEADIFAFMSAIVTTKE